MIPAGFTIYECRITATKCVYILKRRGTTPPRKMTKSVISPLLVFHIFSLSLLEIGTDPVILTFYA